MRIALFAPFVLAGCVNFTYPVVDDTNPLRDPVRVKHVGDDGRIVLTNGVRLRPPARLDADLVRRILLESQHEVEVIPLSIDFDGTIVARIRVKRGLQVHCGTPWVNGIQIPLFPEYLPLWMDQSLERAVECEAMSPP